MPLKDDVMDNYATRPDEHSVQFVRILPGPIERVWDYLWDGKKRGEWFASGPMPVKPGENFDLHFKHSTLSPNQAPPPEKFTETTMMDVVRAIRSNTNAQVTLVEAKPNLAGTPWLAVTLPGCSISTRQARRP